MDKPEIVTGHVQGCCVRPDGTRHSSWGASAQAVFEPATRNKPIKRTGSGLVATEYMLHFDGTSRRLYSATGELDHITYTKTKPDTEIRFIKDLT